LTSWISLKRWHPTDYKSGEDMKTFKGIERKGVRKREAKK
jgi:hypothetical protein